MYMQHCMTGILFVVHVVILKEAIYWILFTRTSTSNATRREPGVWTWWQSLGQCPTPSWMTNPSSLQMRSWRRSTMTVVGWNCSRAKCLRREGRKGRWSRCSMRPGSRRSSTPSSCRLCQGYSYNATRHQTSVVRGGRLGTQRFLRRTATHVLTARGCRSTRARKPLPPSSLGYTCATTKLESMLAGGTTPGERHGRALTRLLAEPGLDSSAFDLFVDVVLAAVAGETLRSRLWLHGCGLDGFPIFW